jgi:hypothetical protein
VSSATLSANSASQGGGIYNNQGTLTLNNSIVANSTGSQDIGNAATLNGSNNLVESGSGLQNLIHTLTADPMLGPLQDNGGPTQTFALLAGSPAINAGDASLLPHGITTDQRGQPRVSGGALDIGAFELQ